MSTESPEVGKRRRRKFVLFFAMGLVLGLLVMTVVAVYRDSRDGDSDWGLLSSILPWSEEKSSDWNVQGNFSVNRADSGWSSFSNTPHTGDFQFSVEPQSMYPGKTVYAPVSLRVDPKHHSFDGRITLQGGVVPEPNVLFSALRYTVGDAGAADCVAGRPGNPRPGFPGSAGTPDPLFTSSDPLRPAILPRDSQPVDFCFAVTLPESLASDVAVRGKSTGPVVWNFVSQADI
ncbi:hypothetical protein OG921_09545 [Aldersonia sp. NBC_00410]|uniref:hypothetical protein n=1 Tax=Aldersonia sp. NBC_00410 TaxID=2975954 RepID=UPI002257FECC|nr:hypothetical protein [Aldersonia sp. NBC_00410]MCX5043414.1 hypothetical protein [Aldersonia sp. NBC_00410]